MRYAEAEVEEIDVGGGRVGEERWRREVELVERGGGVGERRRCRREAEVEVEEIG